MKLSPRERKEQIMLAAIKLAEQGGYDKVHRVDIARRLGISEGLVSRYYSTMVQLRRAIMRRAIHDENITIIAQGLAAKDPLAMKAPRGLREAAAASLV